MPHSDRRAGRRLSHAMQIRLTPEQSEALEARAAKRDVSSSEALRQLLDLGLALDAVQSRGLAISDDAQRIIARREPLNITLAPDPEDPEHGPMWIVTPEELR